jgi:hypothetical protein
VNLQYSYSLAKGVGSVKLYSGSNQTEIWSVSVLDNSVAVSENLFTVSLPRSLLNGSTTYAIEVPQGAIKTIEEYYNEGIPASNWSFTTTSSSLQALYAVLNGSQKSMEVKVGSAMKMDGAASYDPSAKQREGDLAYSWSCSDYSDSYTSYHSQVGNNWGKYISEYVTLNDPLQKLCSFWDYSKARNSTKLEVSQSWSVDQVLRIDFVMKDDAKRSSSASAYVRFTSADSIETSFTSSFSTKVCKDRPLQLAVTLSNADLKYSLDWSVIGPSQPTYLTPLSGTPYLTIAENSLSVGGSYTFTLTYSDSFNSNAAVLSIQVNTPPSGGVMSFDKTTGLALASVLKGRMLSWSDIDLPLSYSYSYSLDTQQPSVTQVLNGAKVSQFLLASQLSSNEVAVSLPSEAKVLIGYCNDALGSESSVTLSVKIEPIEDLVRAKDKANAIESPSSFMSAVKAVSEVTAIAAEMSAFNKTSDTQTVKSSLITVLQVSVAQADTLYSSGYRENAALLYSAILGAFEPLSRQPLSEASLGAIVTLADSIDVGRLKAYNEVLLEEASSAFTTSQEVLSTVNIVNAAQMLVRAVSHIQANSAAESYAAKINSLSAKANKLLGLNSQATEFSRYLNFTDFTSYSRKGTTASFTNTTLSLDNSVLVSIPSLNLTTSSIIMEASVAEFNLVSSSRFFSLNKTLSLTIKDAASEEEIELKDLEDPFVFDFNFTYQDYSRLSLQVSGAQGSQQIWPECTFLSSSTGTWETDGCSLYNIAEAYSYFSSRSTKDVSIQCACTHLSEFSVGFRALQSTSSASYIIRDDNDSSFEMSDWEEGIVLYILLILAAAYFIAMSFAYYWDNFNPAFGLPSIETERVHNYFDPEKVETVLKQLESAFVKQLMESNKSNDPSGYVVKVLNSGLVGKLKETYAKSDNAVSSSTYREPATFYPLEHLMTQPEAVYSSSSSDQDSSISSSPEIKVRSINDRLRSFLDKPIDDSRFNMRIVGDASSGQPSPSRQDIKQTIENLQHRLYLLNNRFEFPSQVDEFLGTYDSCGQLPLATQKKYHLQDRELKLRDLHQLGFNIEEFAALRLSGANVTPDPYMLTGGRYAKKLIEDVDEFYYTLKVNYSTLFSLYFKKEHKVLALFYSLHLEYTKKAMLSFLFLHTLLQLLFTHLYTIQFNWTFDRHYDPNTDVCVWGCVQEGQILAGIFCACMPWPLVYLVKYLLARNSIEYNSPYQWR